MKNSKAPKSGSAALAELSAGKRSGWNERSRDCEADRYWLRRSQRIALHVLDALEAKGMSQKTLAEAIGVTPQYVNKLTKGSENLSLETIGKLEAALGITLLAVCDYAHTVAVTP